MGLYGDGVSTVNLMLTGLRNAVRRLEIADSDQNADELFIAVFEASNWAVSLDDRIGMSWRPRGGDTPLKAAWHAEVPGGHLIAATRFVRNRIHHQWADALRADSSGRRYPKNYPMTYHEWVWRDAEQLPAGKNDQGIDEYVEHLQSRPARVIAGVLEPIQYVVTRLEPVTWLRPPDDHPDGS